MLPVSLDCSFMIDLSVFFNVYNEIAVNNFFFEFAIINIAYNMNLPYDKCKYTYTYLGIEKLYDSASQLTSCHDFYLCSLAQNDHHIKYVHVKNECTINRCCRKIALEWIRGQRI